MSWATSPVGPGALVVTVAYSALLAWGIGVGLLLLHDARHRPARLLNPLFANPWARRLFAVHLAVVTADLLVIGPLALSNKSALWYWGGRVATLSSSLPLAAHLNRNTQSFGRLIGRWVVFRNVAEVGLHVAVAAAGLTWYGAYLLLWWVVAYRFLDVGPRRLLQRRYATPALAAAHPRGPLVNWAVITALYGLAALAVHARLVVYAGVPADSLPPHRAGSAEVAVVLAYNVVVAAAAWGLARRYSESRVAAAVATPSA